MNLWQIRTLRSLVTLLVAGAVLQVGCTKKPSVSETSGGSEAAIPRADGAPAQEQDYVRTAKESPFGRMELFSITPAAFNKRREALLKHAIRRLDLPGSFNTEVYALDGFETPGAVLAKPRLFLRSSVTGDRVRFQENRDGLVVAEVSVALVDGLAPQLFTGKGTRNLPDELTVKNRDDLLNAVEKALGQKPVFLSNIRCPEEIKLRAEGVGVFPVAFKTKLKSCPINTFFPAEITFKKEEWDGLMFAFATGAGVEVETKLNLSLPLTLDYAKFAVKRSAAQAALRRALKDSAEPFTAEQVTDVVKALVDLIQKSFDICIPQELFTPIQDEIVRDQLRMATQPDCPKGAGICFFWNPDAPTVGEYALNTRREEYVGRPLLLDTTAPVNDYLADRQEFMIRALPDSPLAPPQSSELNQLFRTIREGEIAEFRVKQLHLGEITFVEPKIERISNKVCIEPFALCMEGRWRCTNPDTENYNCRSVCSAGYDRRCKRGYPCLGCFEWEDVCRGWSQVCDQRRVCDRLTPPGMPSLPYRTDKVSPSAPDFAWDCTKYAQDQCDPDKWEDHWQRVTTWSLPSATPRLTPAEWKSEYWERVLSGVSIKFSSASDQGTETTVCPISALAHRVVGNDRLVVVFRNTAKCSPFNEQNRKPGYGPSLGLLNQIVFPSDFQCGSVTENWEGKRRYVCRLPEGSEVALETTVAEDEQRLKRGEPLGIHKPYFPRVELQGSLRMAGSYFESRGESR